jgi:hypothetical protein
MAVLLAKAEIGGFPKPGGFVMGCACLLRELGRSLGATGAVTQGYRIRSAFHDCGAGTCGDRGQEARGPEQGEAI